jgi:hypothetical protein
MIRKSAVKVLRILGQSPHEDQEGNDGGASVKTPPKGAKAFKGDYHTRILVALTPIDRFRGLHEIM